MTNTIIHNGLEHRNWIAYYPEAKTAYLFTWHGCSWTVVKRMNVSAASRARIARLTWRSGITSNLNIDCCEEQSLIIRRELK